MPVRSGAHGLQHAGLYDSSVARRVAPGHPISDEEGPQQCKHQELLTAIRSACSVRYRSAEPKNVAPKAQSVKLCCLYVLHQKGKSPIQTATYEARPSLLCVACSNMTSRLSLRP